MKLKEYEKNLKNEYEKTFRKKYSKREFHFKFKLRYAFLAVAGVIFAALLIQHIWVYSYNIGVEKHNQAISDRVNSVVPSNNSAELYPIHTEKDFTEIRTKYSTSFVYQTKKKSILTKLFTLQLVGCASEENALGDLTTSPEIPMESENGNSFQTNIQVEGIDEADVAKCDGSYIYYLYHNHFYVYDIKAEKNITSTIDYGFELFLYNNSIISIGGEKTIIYELNQDKLAVKKTITYERYLTSRLVKNKLYLVNGSVVKEKSIQYENCYYDTCSIPNYVYSLCCFDLDTLESKETQLLSSYSSILYASNQSFYFTSYNQFYTAISIFSFDLEPLGVVYINGSVLNQFSMDEYEGYFRVVSTDTTRKAEELNAISIFDLSDLKKVGYLDQGIGKERQIVKSVRFDKNTCYVVTYENRDPLYEIDCSNPEKPTIVSEYQAPGYSNHLHNFKIGDKEYVLGLGYTDSLVNTKVSVYEKTEEGTSQIGDDFILSYSDYYSKGDYYNPSLILGMFSNHKALFIYNDGRYLYLGAKVAYDAYLILKIDVEAEDVITIDKEIKLKGEKYNSSRLFLVDNKIYVTNCDSIIVDDFS